MRIRSRVAAAARVEAAPRAFPAPNIPTNQRWPVVQFIKQTGVALDEDDARWLADVGQCYEAEGREADLMYAIEVSAGEDVRNPWAYLQCCIMNRGDAYTVTPQLLGDVMAWAGEDSLRYALTAIGGGYVRRSVAHLRRTLRYVVVDGQRPSRKPERPVAAAVAMGSEWAPEIAIIDADEAVAAEDTTRRTGHLESFRRRFGRLPWDPEPVHEIDVGQDVVDGPNCCIGLNITVALTFGRIGP